MKVVPAPQNLTTNAKASGPAKPSVQTKPLGLSKPVQPPTASVAQMKPIAAAAYEATRRPEHATGPQTFAPVPVRRLPPLTEALAHFPALEPRAKRVPEGHPLAAVMNPLCDGLPDIVKTLKAAKRVLVIGHTHPPDGDCVGSAKGLAVALQALGKHAVAVVDQELPADLRRVAGKDVKRAADVANEEFDLVVVVDVAQAARTGGVAGKITNSKNVMLIDHHLEADPRGALGLKDDAKLTSLVMPQWGSAAALVRFAVQHLAEEMKVPVEKVAAKCAEPLAAGMYTDNLGFAVSGAQVHALQLFKHTLGETAGLESLTKLLSQSLSPETERILTEGLRRRDVETVHGLAPVMSVQPQLLLNALETEKRIDPLANKGDLISWLMQRLDSSSQEPGVNRCALLLPQDDGNVRVSVRANEEQRRDATVELAKRIGPGGGKPGSAVANVKGKSLEEAESLVVSAFLEDAMAAQRADPFGGAIRSV